LLRKLHAFTKSDNFRIKTLTQAAKRIKISEMAAVVPCIGTENAPKMSPKVRDSTAAQFLKSDEKHCYVACVTADVYRIIVCNQPLLF